jgi:predicted ArsR family transcriptional regulator
MSAREVTDTLNLHSVAVCPHLSTMEREERMEHRREKTWRGRLIYVYRLIGNAREKESQLDLQRHRN